jgi:hypothetical protein
LKSIIGPDSINQPENGLTLAVELQSEFGDFNLAFEHQGHVRISRADLASTLVHPTGVDRIDIKPTIWGVEEVQFLGLLP